MMIRLWKAISEAGIQFGEDREQKRYIVICNRVSAIVFCLAIAIIVVALGYFGLITSIMLSMVSTLLMLSPILLNHLGFTNASRVVLILMLTVSSTVISIIDKLDHPNTIEDFEFFQYRVILLTSTIYPFILFSVKEKRMLLIVLSVCFLNIILQDPIHEYFNAGYYQMGFTSESYYFVNYMILFAFLILTGSTYFLKHGFEKSEKENELLISKLTVQQVHLEEVNQKVQLQREELTRENVLLNKELVEKNNQLSETNQELIRHNNELQQFSYSVSHNLRGPVASLKGIINLIDPVHMNDSNQELVQHLYDAVSTLDSTISDLNHIIDIRNEVTRFRQKLFLIEELNHIKSLLEREIEDNKVTINYEFDPVFEIYSVKSMLSSILYNLVSNAIKYRDPERGVIINIRAAYDERQVKLEIEDNGLGMDVERFREKIFGLYKRFHTHTEGKGLGLFLVKLQVETLGGQIEINSLPNKGTCFSIYLLKPENLQQQVLLENGNAVMYYNASLNCLGVNWKKNVTATEFRLFITKALDFIKVYKTPNWISNLVVANQRDEEALNAVRKEFNSELKNAGLKRLAVVMPMDQYTPEDYEMRRSVIVKAYDLNFNFFDSFEAAQQWIVEENQKYISTTISNIKN